MSDLRNALPRRSHKERSQPARRANLGLLEKRKDYKLRAADYRSKQARLHRLREIADSRNPDEFYFGMVKRRTNKGVAIAQRDTVALTEAELRVLRTQDAGYISTLATAERNVIHSTHSYWTLTCLKMCERLRAEIHMMPGVGRKHVLFEEAGAPPIKPTGRANAIVGEGAGEEDPSRVRKLLSAHESRLEQLEKIAREIQLQRNLQTSGERKQVGTDANGGAIYKWKPERRR